MWMHAVDTDEGERVHFYKHIDTRRYLWLDQHGRWYGEDSRGHPVPLSTRLP
ncbi:hypothetical protein BH23ACT10_BH23ACT10_16510 [soil metagenome]